MRAAVERAVHLIGCGMDEEARRLLSVHLSGTGAGRALLRAYERDSERAARCLRDHVRPQYEAFLRGEG
jgi:hypothetical protein